jgi:acyl carrier protein
MIDSLGFVEIIVQLEEQLGIEIDLEEMDPEQITMLDPLAAHVAAQANGSAAA